MSGRTHYQPARRAPHPSSCRRNSSVDPDKGQAGRRHAPSHPQSLPLVRAEASDGLNHNAFTLVRPTASMRWNPPPASRSFVLAALWALRLDPGPRPHHHQARATTRTNKKTTTDSNLYPNTDKEKTCRSPAGSTGPRPTMTLL